LKHATIAAMDIFRHTAEHRKLRVLISRTTWVRRHQKR